MSRRNAIRNECPRCFSYEQTALWRHRRTNRRHTALGLTAFEPSLMYSSIDFERCNKVCLALKSDSSANLIQQVLELFDKDFHYLDEQQHLEMCVEDLKALSIMQKNDKKSE